MRRTILGWTAAAVAGAAIALAATRSSADASRAIGLWTSHESETKAELPLGVPGKYVLPTRIGDTRSVVVVPHHYGDLAFVVASATDHVLWYRDSGGCMRNVVVPDAATCAYQIERQPTARPETRLR